MTKMMISRTSTEKRPRIIKEMQMNWWATLVRKYRKWKHDRINDTLNMPVNIVIPKADIKYPPPSAYEVEAIIKELGMDKPPKYLHDMRPRNMINVYYLGEKENFKWTKKTELNKE